MLDTAHLLPRDELVVEVFAGVRALVLNGRPLIAPICALKGNGLGDASHAGTAFLVV